MKSLFFTAFCAVLFSLTSTCFGIDHPDLYVHGFGGANYVTIKRNDNVKIEALPGYIIGAGFGFKFDVIRMELEGSYRSNDFKEDVPIAPNVLFAGGQIDKFAISVNCYYDFPCDIFVPLVKPYVGIGVGHKWNKENITLEYFEMDGKHYLDEYRYKARGLTCQAIVGIGLPMTENTVTKVEYRFLKDEEDVANHSVILNLDRLF
jgi:opacity protein-like surface antigen